MESNKKVCIMNETCLPDMEQYNEKDNSLEICPKCHKVKCSECTCK